MKTGKFYNELCEKVDVFVSEHDIKHPAVIKAIQGAVETGVLKKDYTTEDVLYSIFGFNLLQQHEQENCTHRTRLTNTVVEGIRYVGFERCDDEWLNHPLCSKEMKMEMENIIGRERGRF